MSVNATIGQPFQAFAVPCFVLPDLSTEESSKVQAHVVNGFEYRIDGTIGLDIKPLGASKYERMVKTPKEWVAFFKGTDINRDLQQYEWSFIVERIFNYL